MSFTTKDLIYMLKMLRVKRLKLDKFAFVKVKIRNNINSLYFQFKTNHFCLYYL